MFKQVRESFVLKFPFLSKCTSKIFFELTYHDDNILVDENDISYKLNCIKYFINILNKLYVLTPSNMEDTIDLKNNFFLVVLASIDRTESIDEIEIDENVTCHVCELAGDLNKSSNNMIHKLYERFPILNDLFCLNSKIDNHKFYHRLIILMKSFVTIMTNVIYNEQSITMYNMEVNKIPKNCKSLGYFFNKYNIHSILTQEQKLDIGIKIKHKLSDIGTSKKYNFQHILNINNNTMEYKFDLFECIHYSPAHYKEISDIVFGISLLLNKY